MFFFLNIESDQLYQFSTARNQLAEIIKIHLSLGIIDRSRNTKDIFVFDFQYLKFLFFLKDRVFNNFLENDLKRVIY